MNDDKLGKIVKVAQSYILLFLSEFMNAEELQRIERMFQECPVIADRINSPTQLGRKENIGGIAEKDRIVVCLDCVNRVNLNNEIELNNMLGTIIHEYAHKIRAINNSYGEMLEESFSTIFAEACINNARFKLNDDQKTIQSFEMLNSVNYQKYESQVRTFLYVLKQRGLDKQLIYEYVAGNQERFKQVCIQIFGNEFLNYFNSITSSNNVNSEQMLIQVIVEYIKKNGLNIQNYWENNKSNLYFQGSPTLSRAVVSAGPNSFSAEEQQAYHSFEYSVKVANENDNVIDQEKIDRIKKYIAEKFSLRGKNIDDVYDTVIDLCSEYIQRKSRDDEDSKIFINELLKLIPNMDEFRSKFLMLRVARKDMEIFNNLNMENISYADIIASMDSLLEENKNNGMSR